MNDEEFKLKYGEITQEITKELLDFLGGLIKENISKFESDRAALNCLLNVGRNFFFMMMNKLADFCDSDTLTMIRYSKIVECIEQQIKENEDKNEKV